MSVTVATQWNPRIRSLIAHAVPDRPRHSPRFPMTSRFILLGLLLGIHTSFVHAGDIRGAGATFPSDVYKGWAAAYEKERGGKVSYLPTGSGDGIKRIIARQVDFGAALTLADVALE